MGNLNNALSMCPGYEEELRKPNISSQEMQNLIIKYKKCKLGTKEKSDLRETIILKNMKLVILILNSILGKNWIEYNNREDLFGCGLIGIIYALDKYDIEKGKFTTYATRWIIREIVEGIRIDRTIKIPLATEENLRKKLKELNIDIRNEADVLKMITEISKTNKRQDQTLLSYLQAQIVPLSLDEPLSNEEDNGNTRIDFIQSETSVIEQCEQIFLKEELAKLIKKADLSKNQKRILEYRYGLNTDEPRNLTEISKIMGMTHQAVSYNEQAALTKLREMPGIEEFAIYIGMHKPVMVKSKVN